MQSEVLERLSQEFELCAYRPERSAQRMGTPRLGGEGKLSW